MEKNITAAELSKEELATVTGGLANAAAGLNTSKVKGLFVVQESQFVKTAVQPEQGCIR